MRSHNDWMALKRAEREGHEEPGTFKRLWDEAQKELAAAKKKVEEVKPKLWPFK